MLSATPLQHRRWKPDLLITMIWLLLLGLLAVLGSRSNIHPHDDDNDKEATTTIKHDADNEYAEPSTLHAYHDYNNFNNNDFDPNMTQHWFRTPLDHFNFRPTTPSHLQLRYFVNDQYFDTASNTSSVIWYAGNEAPIEQFIHNTGFLWELAAKFHSLIVFCEHRYYGQSFPFPDDIPKSLSPHNIQYLTVEQAMADNNLLQQHLRTRYKMERGIPFIVTGGSYGGNLALWLRLKNPNLWAGALASSATPLKHLLRQSNAFARIVYEVYYNVSAECPNLVQRGWQQLIANSETAQGRQHIQRELHLCQLPSIPQDLVNGVYGWISSALETMVQYGYPYPTQFYNPVPGFPFRVACQAMLNSTSKNASTKDDNDRDESHNDNDHQALKALYAAANVYYNYTGQAGSCFDWFGSGGNSIDGGGSSSRQQRNMDKRKLLHHPQHFLNSNSGINNNGPWNHYWNRLGQVDRFIIPNNNGMGGNDDKHHTNIVTEDNDYVGTAWNYQCCTEVYQPMPTNGKTDLELPHRPNRTQYFQNCQQRWQGVTPRPNWEEMTFWSHNIAAGTNIFLTSGQLDPWRAAGIVTLPKGALSSIIVRVIVQGAHHLDLRGSHPLDPPSVTQVRQEEMQAIRAWIAEWKNIYNNSGIDGDGGDESHDAMAEL